MGRKRLCVNCYVSGPIPYKKFTYHWCSNCEMPLCPIGCYDIHRHEKLEEVNEVNKIESKKRKKK